MSVAYEELYPGMRLLLADDGIWVVDRLKNDDSVRVVCTKGKYRERIVPKRGWNSGKWTVAPTPC